MSDILKEDDSSLFTLRSQEITIALDALFKSFSKVDLHLLQLTFQSKLLLKPEKILVLLLSPQNARTRDLDLCLSMFDIK